MKLVNKIRNLKLSFNDDLINKLSTIGNDHFPNEFGGFLIGYYKDTNALLVTDFILPKKYKGLPNKFQRSSEGTEERFNRFYNEEPRKYYVGEWHTHPNGTTMYSQSDLDAMISIEKCATVKIKNPILLIIGVKEEGISDFDFYLYEKNKLKKYEEN